MTDTTTAEANNVVELAEAIVQNGEASKAAQELELKRKAALKAFTITMKQLEADALRFEEQAIVGELTIQRRHELMEHARALRISVGWLQMLVTPEAEEKPDAT